jgi:TetR/AcrR family transcriptional regulator, mexJK operon transcriptional repressor
MSENTNQLRKAGRPRDDAKREAILDCAWQLFLREGVEATSLNTIAKRANVTRVTLYSHFADKSALFEATVEREMSRLAATQVLPKSDGNLRDVLITYGTALMSFLTSPGPISYYNVLAGELRRHPDLARRFYDQGPAMSVKNLAAILKNADASESLSIASPETAAEHLIGLWQGVSNYKLALGLDIDEQIDSTPKKVADAVDIFLRAYRANQR